MSDQDKNQEESPEKKEGENNQNNEPNHQEEHQDHQENQNPEEGVNNQNENENENENPEEEDENQEGPPEENENNQEQQKENKNENMNNNNQEEVMEENEEEELINKNRKKYNKSGIENIQHQIQELSKKIEHEKINLRIISERLTQKVKTYNELQGKPINKTNEEKEKERKEYKKIVKAHRLYQPIQRKQGKEKEYQDQHIKNKKAYNKSLIDFEKLTGDINELIVDNRGLRTKIVDLRKRKVEAQKQLELIKEENKKSKEELTEIVKDNQTLKERIKYNEYKRVVEFGKTQDKYFLEQRDDYEERYHKLIKEFVRREKETKKENAKKRQMALLGSGSHSHILGMNDKEVEKQLKILAEEEICDRTPILDLEIEKWTEINSTEKKTIERHYENCVKIEEAFKKLTKFLGLDSFGELPEVFRKTEQQMANINIYNEKLDLQIDKLVKVHSSIKEQIKLLSGKETDTTRNKYKFKEQKERSIKTIEKLLVNFEKNIEHKRELFKRIQPATDNYLATLGESYLADFIPKKMNIDTGIEYNEQTVNKYLSNVQDYYKLVQTWSEASKGRSEENKELDRLREEMKTKLGGFEKNRILSKKLISNMKNELKNGVNIEEIIKKSSLEITSQPNMNSTFSSNPNKLEKKNNSSLMNNSQSPTDMVNNSGSRFLSVEQNQSNLIFPNNNSIMSLNNKNNESAEPENPKAHEI